MAAPNPRFDPYWKWLGILPKDQPPHHYRLLGIELFERDAEVIANAADQRMLILKNFQAGKHSDVSQKILNEIAAAKICLLNAQKKAAYDKQLAASPGGRVDGPPALLVDPSQNGLPAVRSRNSRAADRPRHTLGILVATVILAAAVVALAIAIIDHPGQPLAKAPQLSAANMPTAPPARPIASQPPQQPPAKPTSQTPEPQSAAKPLPEVAPSAHLDSPAQQPTAPLEPKASLRPSASSARQSLGVPSPTTRTASKEKLSVPDQAASNTLTAQVRGQIYHDEFVAAKTNPQKVALAEKLRHDGLATRDDPAARFVLLRMASELAAEAGDLSRASRAVNDIAIRYEIDSLAMKADALDLAVKAAPTDPDAAIHRQIATRAQQLADGALKQLRPDLARDLLKKALISARRTKDRQLAVAIQSQLKSVERLEPRINSTQDALKTLVQTPDDAAANLLVGTTYCFALGAWNEGLPHLAKTNDPILRDLATADLARPQDPDPQVELADRWWKLAEGKKAIEKQHIQDQAEYWYRKALPKLTGLARTKVEKQLASLDDTPPSYVLVFDGRESVAGVPGFFYDGQMPITIEAIVTPASNQNEMGVSGNILDQGYGQRERAGLELGMRGQRWCFSICTVAGPSGPFHLYRLGGGDRVIPGRTANLTATYDGREARLYVDGRLVNATATEGIHKPSPLPMLIGAEAIKASPTLPVRMGRHFHGVIDSIRLSAIVRYDPQGFDPPKELLPDRDTTLLLKFDQGRGDVVVSQAGGRRIRAQLDGATWMDRQQWQQETGGQPSQ